MTCHQLRVFLAIADGGGFARGAEALRLSQPTVSQHIAALETEVGIALLDRSRKGVALTEAGKLLRRHARRVVAAMDAAGQAVERFRGVEAAPLRAGASTIPATYLLPAAIAALFAVHPGLRLILVHGDSREILDRLASDDVEVGMVGSRFDERGLAYTPAGQDVIRLVVAPGHPWAQAGRITLSELADKPLVLREPGSGTGKAVEEALRKAGMEPSVLRARAEVGSTEAVKASVACGVGAAFLSEWAFRNEAERGELVAVGVDGLTIERSFYLVRRTGRPLSPAAEAFSEALFAHCAQRRPGCRRLGTGSSAG